MFWSVVFLSIILISFGFLGMALTIIIKKKGKFPAYQIGHNSSMAKMGIRCVKHEEIRGHNAILKKSKNGCSGCQQLV